MKRMLPRVASLYKGVVGAASGAGIYIGTYFAFYGAACNVLSRRTDLSPGGVAFVAGGVAAAGGSVVKVPLAVCIRSVQVGAPIVLELRARSLTRNTAGRVRSSGARKYSPLKPALALLTSDFTALNLDTKA